MAPETLHSMWRSLLSAHPAGHSQEYEDTQHTEFMPWKFQWQWEAKQNKTKHAQFQILDNLSDVLFKNLADSDGKSQIIIKSSPAIYILDK